MRSIFKSRQLLVLTILALAIIFLFAILDNSDLSKFPFKSEIWGTVSDWIMVIVTGFTAYYLVKSFEAQKINNSIQATTLKEQQKLTIIEQYIHRERVKPSFELRPFLKSTSVEGDVAKYSYSFHFFVQNGTAKNISIEGFLFNHELGINEHLFGGTTNEKSPGDNIGFMEKSYSQKKLEKPIDGAEYVFRFEFFLEFDDILNNRYKNSIMFYENSNGLTNMQVRGFKIIKNSAEED